MTHAGERVAALRPGLRLRLLGGFAAWVDGVPVDAAAWRRRKVSRLVKLLALEPEHRLHREQVECCCGRTSVAGRPAQNLHHTLYRGRHTLEPELGAPAEPRFLRLHNDLLELAPATSSSPTSTTFEAAAAAALASARPGAVRERGGAASAASCCPRSASRTGRSSAARRSRRPTSSCCSGSPSSSTPAGAWIRRSTRSSGSSPSSR